MNELLEMGNSLLKTITGSGPGAPLTIAVCIGLGYAIKFSPLKNEWIPLAVMAVGTAFFPLVTSPAIVPHDCPSPIAFQIGAGFLLSCAAWAIHGVALKRVEDWLGAKFGGAEKEKPLGP